ncbi:MAG: single-stranded-DNA-specific exonuclease RecJ [Bryobacteraceae bacterium]|nr:single-stranded-DNA-specific exonuclease RecJ [Bryobacteraceae bacterium]
MFTPARWLLPQIRRAEVESLSRELPITLPAARVLWHRGYRDPDAARRYLNPAVSDLHDPYLLSGMRRAVDRLRRAIQGGEKILLYGDYDVDGASSVVILKKAIELAGGSAVHRVPDRLGEGYGMSAGAIRRAAAEGTTLVVSVDTGIRAIEAVSQARELGIDVVVTDHHLPDAELPSAYAVVNPNQPGCAYPDKNLCGAGVALKLAHALLGELGWPEARLQRIIESLLKMVAIATVADVVPLTGENRIIVKHGLTGLRSVRNPGLRALLDVAGFGAGDSPSAVQVAFRIAPRINAAGRMATAEDVIRLFLTNDEDEARRLALQLHELNRERQETETEIVRAILDDCARTPVTPGQAALVFSGEAWHPGVVGIVANRLVERFHRPVFVLSVDAGSGEARGSGRSIPAFHLLEALEAMRDLFLRFGGHRGAAGLTLPAGRIGDFRFRLNAYAARRLGPEDFIPQQEFDARLEFHEITEKTAADVLKMAPFGFGNPAPLFAVEGVELACEPVPFKDNHLRVRLRQNGRQFWVKAWNFRDRSGELTPGARLDAALCFEADAYSEARGYPAWNLTLRDVR